MTLFCLGEGAVRFVVELNRNTLAPGDEVKITGENCHGRSLLMQGEPLPVIATVTNQPQVQLIEVAIGKKLSYQRMQTCECKFTFKGR